MEQNLTARFLRYVQIDTTSDSNSPTAPSTEKQWRLLHLLADELREMGAHEVEVTSYGCVLATIPATTTRPLPTIAFFAHVDTTAQFNGTDVRPILHPHYDGSPIILPDDPTVMIDPADFPYLATQLGNDVITASGKTLLGADDKAGVAIVMSVAEQLLHHRTEEHGKIRLCFTPDEEIGRGVVNLDLAALGADVAYTLDGGGRGEIEYETFSADLAVVTIQGVSIHPGYAYGKMVNATQLAAQFVLMLGQRYRNCENSQGREGFIHITNMTGGSSEMVITMILRDFEREELAKQGALVQQLCQELQSAEPRATISAQITTQYRNMRYWLENDMKPVEHAIIATQAVGLTPISTAIRGGTDGSRLTEMGLPTPNLFTGMQNIHGPQEWVAVQDMVSSAEMCLALVYQWAK